jgi:hypothetical protein
MKCRKITISKRMLFSPILLFLGLISSAVAYAETTLSQTLLDGFEYQNWKEYLIN